MNALLDCIFLQWQPGLGDPHVMGWVTVGVYVLAAAAALRASGGRFPEPTRRRERAFWVLAAVVLGFLAINKQLDLQSFFTAAGRCVAKAQGWYQDRFVVQRNFILLVIVLGSAAILGLLASLRGTLARTGVALLGLGFVCIFVVIRAAGFHHMDALINTWIAGLRLNWLLELPGPVLVLVSALRGSTPTR